MKIHKIFSLAKTKIIYYNSVEAEICFFCYCGYVNVIYGAVTLLLNHAFNTSVGSLCEGQEETEQNSSVTAVKIVFERLNINKYGV